MDNNHIFKSESELMDYVKPFDSIMLEMQTKHAYNNGVVVKKHMVDEQYYHFIQVPDAEAELTQYYNDVQTDEDLKQLQIQEALKADAIKATGLTNLQYGKAIIAMDAEFNFAGVGVCSYKELFNNHITHIDVIESDSMHKYNRRYYNRMTDTIKQDAYIKRLEKIAKKYHAYKKDGKSFEINKTLTDGFRILNSGMLVRFIPTDEILKDCGVI